MSQSNNTEVAVLIIFFNKLLETLKCIESFSVSGVNIYILNNGSEECAWKRLQEKYLLKSNISLINSIENIGPSKGRNLLIESSTEEWLFFVDNDIIIKEKTEWYASFNNCVRKNKDAKIFCPKLFNVYENEFAKHSKFVLVGNEVFLEQNYAGRTNYFPSGASIINRSVFNQYGLFDEKLFAFEDYEFAIRMLIEEQNPIKVYNIDNITLIHDHKFQVSKVDRNAVKARYNELRLTDSFEWMQEKHNIKFIHDWQWWSKKQIIDMTGKTIFQRIKGKIKRALSI